MRRGFAMSGTAVDLDLHGGAVGRRSPTVEGITGPPADEPVTPKVSQAQTSSKRCVVWNLTVLDFRDVTITHKYATVGSHKDTFKRDILRSGDDQEFDLTRSAGGGDQWTFSLTAGDDTYDQGHFFPKSCALTPEDWQSDIPVFFIFHPIKDGYSIALPKSSSCMYNTYH